MGNSEVPAGFPPRRILVATDGSENAKRAENVAVRFAKDYGAELLIVCVAPVPVYYAPGFSQFGTTVPMDIRPVIDASEKEAANLVTRSEELAKSQGVAAVKGRVLQPASSVVYEITRCAQDEKADLIIIGTRGLGGFKKLLLGSVSNGVLTHAHCNVLIIK